MTRIERMGGRTRPWAIGVNRPYLTRWKIGGPSVPTVLFELATFKYCFPIRFIREIRGLIPDSVVRYSRWQTIAGEPQGSLEESPNTIRQHAAENTRAPQL